MRLRYLVLLALFCALGCGGEKVASVSGTVTLDGKPLPNAAVTFQPVGEGSLTPGEGSYARTDNQGRYTLERKGGQKGAVVGRHRVEITARIDDGQDKPDQDRRTRAKERVPPRYNTQSTLNFEVKPGENTANFPLESQ